VADISDSVLCGFVAARAVQCHTGTTNDDSQTQVSNVKVKLSTRPATVNNGHVVAEQKCCRSTANVATRLNNTHNVHANSHGMADEPACQKNAQHSADDVSLVHSGSWLSSSVFSRAVNQRDQSTSREHCFKRQLDAFHGVVCEQSTTPQFTETRQSYVNETRLERPGFSTVTSYSMTSSHTASGPPRPVTVDDTPVTSQVTLGGRSQCLAVSGPSVERSWETLRTESTRSAVIPHKTTSPPRVVTAGPQDKMSVIVPVQHNNNNMEHRRLSVEQRVRSQCSRAHADQLDIIVIKTGLALGFSIDGGKDSLFGDRPVTVKRVFRGRSALTVHCTCRLISIS